MATDARKYLARAESRQAASDPVMFAQCAGFTADAWQADVLRCKDERVMLNCTRQGGKSTIIGVGSLHEALYADESLILLLAPTLRQSSELFRKVMGPYRKLRRNKFSMPATVEETKLSVEFENGSRIVCLPESEDTIRGFSAPRRVVMDECAFSGDPLYQAVFPMFATNRGQLFLISTPNGRRGFYYKEWHREQSRWKKFRVSAHDCPRISKAFLAEARGSAGPLLFRQEYECEFIAGATGQVYSHEPANDVNALPELQYHLLAIDYGFNDECAFTVLGWRDNDPVVYVVTSKKYSGMTPSAAAEHAKGLDEQYRFTRIVGDTGGLGKGYAEEARARFGLPIEAAEKNNKRGYIDLLNDALRTRHLAVFAPNCGELVTEWDGLVWDEGRQKEQAGLPNHCADATLYGWRAATAYLNTPLKEKPKVGTDAYLRDVEARLEAQVDEELEREDKDEWWAA